VAGEAEEMLEPANHAQEQVVKSETADEVKEMWKPQNHVGEQVLK
jgi:hypothetical protein